MKPKSSIFMVLMFIMLACNMRAPFTGVGAIVSMIREDLDISNAWAGMISTIPLLVFAVVCPLSAPIARKVGMGRMLLAALGFILCGELIRSWGGEAGLLLGTAVLSVGIAIENVLVMGLVKQRFPDQPGIMTSIVTTTMAVTACLAIGGSVPLAKTLGLGWRGALGIWAVVAAASFLLWLPQANKPENYGVAAREGPQTSLMKILYKQPSAWCLMVFMGTQSMAFYCITAWVPSILQSRGFSVAAAATAATVLQLASLPSTLLVPLLAEKFQPRKMVILFSFMFLGGALLFYFFPFSTVLTYVSIIILSIGMGSGFSFCFLFFALRTQTAEQTAALSGMAQSGGYLLAAIGPVLMGKIFDVTGSWNLAMLFLFGVLLAMSASGIISATQKQIFPEES